MRAHDNYTLLFTLYVKEMVPFYFVVIDSSSIFQCVPDMLSCLYLALW